MGLHSRLEIRNSTSRINRRLSVLIQNNRLRRSSPGGKDVGMIGFAGSPYNTALGKHDTAGSRGITFPLGLMVALPRLVFESAGHSKLDPIRSYVLDR
jgi:hypothetical protein